MSFSVILTAIVTVLRSDRRLLPNAAGPSADAGAMRRLLDRAMVRLLPRAALVAIVLAVMTLLVRWTTALVALVSILGESPGRIPRMGHPSRR